MDRASGSGVFARDPDAQLDIIELELDSDIRKTAAPPGASGWRLECINGAVYGKYELSC